MHRILSLIPALLLLAGLSAAAQNLNRRELPEMELSHARRLLQVPSVDGFIPLKCDFHMHTVFSDGEVWPRIRLDEAWTDGLDAIAITDHDNYRPHKDFVSGNYTTSPAIVYQEAAERGILVIPAIEVTRKMPPGHVNAFFIPDTDIPELHDTSRIAFMTAMTKLHHMGALMVWNHPGWAAQQKDTVKWFGIHETMLMNGWLNGIEVFNTSEWYPVAIQWAVEKNLAPFANSDIHGPMRSVYNYSEGFIRPMTLVFATERTKEALHDAIVAGRTVAWFDGMLAGHPPLLAKLFAKSVSSARIQNRGGKTTWMISNTTDLAIELKGTSAEWKGTLSLPPRSAGNLTVKEDISSLPVEVTNWHTGMKQCLTTDLLLGN
ncbi:MAG TPA: PHP domain-containing protein [Bacteroidales bacterium]|nr:PHP domain-containing protein [Bacteroidales bacterium]